MKMENNSVDKFFASKLRHLEKAPGLSTWDRLYQLQQEKKQKKISWFAVAASVLVLLSLGIATWQYASKIRVQEPVTAEKSTQPEKQLPIGEPLSSENKTDANEALKKHDQQVGVEKKQKRILLASKEKKKSSAAHLSAVNVTPEKEVVNTENLSYANTNKPDQFQPSVELTQESASEAKTTVVVLNIDERTLTTAPSPTSLEANALEVTPSDTDKRQTRAGKIFQQIKKLKNGGKVDWKEVGIRPDNLLALIKPDRETKRHEK